MSSRKVIGFVGGMKAPSRGHGVSIGRRVHAQQALVSPYNEAANG
jgi:hypothetical protein